LAEPKEGSGEKTPKTCNSEIKSWRLVIRYQQTGNQNGNPGYTLVVEAFFCTALFRR
jgi:hypothetical protein